MFTQAISVVGNASTARDRRAFARIHTIYRVAKARSRDDLGLCHVLNISDGGAMIQTGLSLSVGDWTSLELMDAVTLDATVAWQKNGRTGIKFAVPIDCLSLLKRLSNDHWNDRTRDLWLSVEKEVEVTNALGTATLLMKDVSQKGLKLRDSGKLKPGMEVCVRLSDELVVRGHVRWVRGLDVGVELQGKVAACDLRSARALQTS